MCIRDRHSRAAKRLLPATATHALEAAIATSESGHSGEIRIVVEGGLAWPHILRHVSAHARALELFGALRIWDTEARNGVLIYLLLAERRIQILADRGLNRLVEPHVWQSMVTGLAEQLRQNPQQQALVALHTALHQVDALLRQHFSLTPGARNVDELCNRVVLL